MAEGQIKITAETSQAQAALGNLDKSLNNLDKSSKNASNGLGNLGSTAKFAVGAFSALTAAIGIRQIVDLSGRYTDLNSRLINATGSSKNAADAFNAISASARRTFSNLETTADVFVRNSMVLNELGLSTKDQIKVSEALNNAMAISGSRGEQASNALNAFANSLAKGKLDTEAFNSLAAQSPRVIKALGDGLGVTTIELRKMAGEGKLTAEVVIPALTSQLGKLKTEAEAMPPTIADAFIVLQNKLLESTGSIDKSLGGITGKIAEFIVAVADNTPVLIGAIAGLGVAVAALLIPLIPAATAMAILTGGLAVAGAVAAGAALGFAADKAGLFGKETKAAVKGIDDTTKVVVKSTGQLTKEQEKLNEATDKANGQYAKKLALLDVDTNYNKQLVSLGKIQADINKAIAEEEATRAEQHLPKLTAGQRELTANKMLENAASELATNFAKLQLDYEIEALQYVNDNKVQRDIILAQKKLELDYGIKLTPLLQKQLDLDKAKVASQISYNAALAREQNLRDKILSRDIELGKVNANVEKAAQDVADQERAIAAATTDEQRQQLTERLTDYKKFYKQTVDLEMMAVSDSLRVFRDLAIKQNSIDTALTNARKVGYDEDSNNYKILLNDKLLAEQEYHAKTLQLNENKIAQELIAKKGAYNLELDLNSKAMLQEIGRQERIKRSAASIIAFEKKSVEEKTQFAIQQGADAFNALGAQNKKAFEIAKAFNIANAIMNTFVGASAALRDYPPPFSFIAAAAQVAFGLAQVAQIRAQTFSGRALGGPVVGGQTYMVGERGPETFTPTTAGTITPNNQLGGGTTNITFNIVANDTKGFDQLLVERRPLITKIIRDAQLEQGRRQI